MKSFKDDAGRNWTLNITVHALERVKALVDVDLLALDQGTPPLVERLTYQSCLADVVLLCDVLFALLKPDAEALSPPVTDEEFARGMGGDGLTNAAAALAEELRDFFRKRRQDHPQLAVIETQEKLTAMVAEKHRQILARLAPKQAAELQGLDPDRLIDAAREKILQSQNARPPGPSIPGSPSTSSPASSESTPDPSP